MSVQYPTCIVVRLLVAQLGCCTRSYEQPSHFVVVAPNHCMYVSFII
jgi:hypothetical protein